ncbi:MAG: hypothetical protein JSV79_12065 [Armatimonadota bacterium]|nr:MAG: hypothetical protein JSV79_12065 [Armatimonadota bacterium]
MVFLALLAVPTILIGPALRAGNALLPADLLVQFEPWRSQVATPIAANWDPLVWDGIAQHYPWRQFASESLRAGRLPLWNPYQFCGTPFLANGQSAVLYPLNVLFWVLPVAIAFAWSAWLHLLLTGWFAYLLLRRIGAGRFGALAGAVVWQANGFLIAWIHLPTVLCTATWLPLALLCCERALTAGRGRYGLAAGSALGLSYLAGHPQIFLFAALLTGGYLVARGLSRGLGVPFRERAGRLMSTGAMAGVMAAGLAAAQLLPTLDLLRIAHRTFVPGPESYAAFLKHAMPPVQLFGLVVPHAFGHPALGTYAGQDNFAEFAGYVGIVALGLALWGALFSRTWQSRFFGCALLLSALVALGTQANWPLYRGLPGMARAGGPGRVLLLSVFSLSMLAGLGADAAMRRSAERKTSALLVLIGVFAGLAGAAWFWWARGIPQVAEVRPATAPLARAEVMLASVLLVVAVALLVCAGRKPIRRICQFGLLAVLAADLLLAAQHHIHTAPLDWVYPQGAVSAPSGGRVVGNAKDWPIDRFPNAVLPPNAAMVYHMRDVFGYDSLYLARYRDFAAAVQHGDPSPPLNGNLLLARLAPIYGLDMMSLAGVETVFSPVPLRWLWMERAGVFYTYRNPRVWPRAWVAESAVFEPTHHEAVVALAQLGPMADCILITGPDEPMAELPEGLRPPVEVQDLSPNEVAVRLPAGGGGYLFLADGNAPGWHAYAGDAELAVRTAYVTFRAVAPPQDARSVVFRYEPASFGVGLFISLVMLCIAAAGAAASSRVWERRR